MLMPGLNLMANILPGYPEGFIHLRESTSAGHGLKLKQTYWKKKEERFVMPFLLQRIQSQVILLGGHVSNEIEDLV